MASGYSIIRSPYTPYSIYLRVAGFQISDFKSLRFRDSSASYTHIALGSKAVITGI